RAGGARAPAPRLAGRGHRIPATAARGPRVGPGGGRAAPGRGRSRLRPRARRAARAHLRLPSAGPRCALRRGGGRLDRDRAARRARRESRALPRRGPVAPAFAAGRQAPPRSSGRWSRLSPPASARTPPPAERAKAQAEQLLSRHGILTRAAVLAEGVPGGFASLYPVLRALEESGRVRRGYFVSGLGGSQFAHPGALERLRALRDSALGPEEEPPGAVLAATDPANPYGATLPWPKVEGGRLQRSAGVHVVLVDGSLLA